MIKEEKGFLMHHSTLHKIPAEQKQRNLKSKATHINLHLIYVRFETAPTSPGSHLSRRVLEVLTAIRLSDAIYYSWTTIAALVPSLSVAVLDLVLHKL